MDIKRFLLLSCLLSLVCGCGDKQFDTPQALMAKVTPLQTDAALPPNPLNQKILEKFSKGVVIIAMGTCLPCVHYDNKEWMEFSKQTRLPVIGIVTESEKSISAWRKKTGATLPIYLDADRKWHQDMDARWNGRVYYIRANGTLAWLSQNAFAAKMLEPELLQAVRLP